jgi:hypothetical protein
VLPQHIPTLEGKDAEKFVAQDKKPLSREQKADLLKCREIYKKNPVK